MAAAKASVVTTDPGSACDLSVTLRYENRWGEPVGELTTFPTPPRFKKRFFAATHALPGTKSAGLGPRRPTNPRPADPRNRAPQTHEITGGKRETIAFE